MKQPSFEFSGDPYIPRSGQDKDGRFCLPFKTSGVHFLIRILLATLTLGSEAGGATVTFDADLLLSGIQESGGNFNWPSAGVLFWNGATNVAAGTGDVVQFGNGGTLSSSAVISVSSQTVNGLIFGAGVSNGYSLTGLGTGQVLTLGGSGIVANVSAQATNLGDAGLSLRLAAAQTWSNFSANGAALTVNGNIDNQGFLLSLTGAASSPIILNGVLSGSGGLTKGNGQNSVTLGNAANTFTGPLSILRGVLSVMSLADSGAGSNGTGAIQLGTGAQTGSLTYGGSGAVLSRVINLTGTTGGGIITHSGTGLLKWTGNLTFATPSANAKTLTLQGSTSGVGEFAGVIANNPGGGITSVVKTGSGTWTLSGNNSYTGGTDISGGGVLNINTATAIGSSTLTFSGNATIDNTSGAAILFTGNNGITLSGGSLTFNGTSDLDLGSGVLLISGGNRTATLQSGSLFVGAINADTTARTFTKSGAGTLVVAGPAGLGFQGGITVSAGVLRLRNATAAGVGTITLSNSTAELEIAGSLTVANSLVVGNTGAAKVLRLGDGWHAAYAGDIAIQETTAGNFTVVVGGGDELTLSGGISGVGQLAVQRNTAGDGGTVILSGNNAHALGTVVGAEMTVRIQGSNALGASVSLSNTGARLELGPGVIVPALVPLSVGGSGDQKTLALSASATSATYAGTVTILETTAGFFEVMVDAGKSLVLAGAVGGAGGAGVTKQGAGLLIMSASNDYAGPTDVLGGVLQVGDGGTSGSITGSLSMQVASGAIFRTNRSGSLVLTQAITGAGEMVIANDAVGVTILANAANSYSGRTTVSSGTLQVGVGGVGKTGTGDVLLQSGAMQGSGIVQGSAFTAASGTAVHVGDSAAAGDVSLLTFAPASGAGAFDFQAGSSVFLGLAPGQTKNSDRMSFVGTGANILSFHSALTVGPASLVPTTSEIFHLLDWTGLASSPVFDVRFAASSYAGWLFGNGDDSLGFDLPDVSGSGFVWDISSFTVNGSIALVAVPEPGRMLLISGSMLVMLCRRRRW